MPVAAGFARRANRRVPPAVRFASGRRRAVPGGGRCVDGRGAAGSGVGARDPSRRDGSARRPLSERYGGRPADRAPRALRAVRGSPPGPRVSGRAGSAIGSARPRHRLRPGAGIDGRVVCGEDADAERSRRGGVRHDADYPRHVRAVVRFRVRARPQADTGRPARAGHLHRQGERAPRDGLLPPCVPRARGTGIPTSMRTASTSTRRRFASCVRRGSSTCW